MRFYKLALLKAYFDEGYGFTSYFKYLIAFYGMASLDVRGTMIVGLGYGVSCFGIGWLIFKSRFKNAQIEVQNRVNPFVGEMRSNYLSKI